MSRITITDVAEKANTSKSTVSQYLSNRYEYMSAETRRRIAAAIEELGFRPNVLAQGLKKKKSKTIGIILPNVMYSFSSQVFRAIEDYFYGCGYQVICCNSDDDAEKERNYIEMLLDKQVDGFISFATGKTSKPYKDLEARKFPVVLVGRKLADTNIDIVRLDEIKAAYTATKHLIDAGHTRIAVITLPIDHQSPRADRLQGYRDALADHGLPVRESYVHSVPVALIQARIDAMLRSAEPPTALLLGNDFILHEMLVYARNKSIKIPDQIAVIAFDQSPNLDFYKPSISTMTLPANDIGRKAAEVLLAKIGEKNHDGGTGGRREFVFEARLDLRESC